MTPVVVAPLPGGGSFRLSASRDLTAADAQHILDVLNDLLPRVDAPDEQPAAPVDPPAPAPPRRSFEAVARELNAPKAQDDSR